MSALQFFKRKSGDGLTANATCDLCLLRSGRWAWTLAGYPQGRCCQRCKGELTKVWEGALDPRPEAAAA